MPAVPGPQMPRCLLPATTSVREHLLGAGVVHARDVANWWSSTCEVEEYGKEAGWDRADTQSAKLAWSEAERLGDRSLPGVPVPVAARQVSPTPALALAQVGAEVTSLARLTPAPLPPAPTQHLKLRLWRLYLELGSEGLQWASAAPWETWRFS